MSEKKNYLFDGEETIEQPTLRLWCEMAYPNDRLSALRAWEFLLNENRAMQEEGQEGYSHLGTTIMKDMVKSHTMGKLCGLVAMQVRWNVEKSGAPHLNRAVFAVTEYLRNEKTAGGKKIPTDGKRLRTSFSNKYRNTLHLWAALMIIDETHGSEKIYAEPKVFDEFLFIALDMQKFFLATDRFKDTNFLKVSTSIEKKFPNQEVVFPEEPDQVQAILESYHPKFTR